MLNRFFVAIFALLTSSAAMAEVAKDDIIFGMRDLIYAGDIADVEAYVAKQHERYLAGEIPAEHMRLLFFPFGWSNPRTAEFADAWLVDEPTSPFAQMAKAWPLHNFSQNIRGEDIARRTYSDALRTFSGMQREAWALTTAAYESMPRLIPASDGILRMANANRGRRRALEVLDAVMAVDPNPGTLERALSMAMPGWGAKYSMVEDICAKYAAIIKGAPPQPELSCLIKGAKFFQDKQGWVVETLQKEDLPHLDHRRLSALIGPSASREDAQLAYDILNTEGYINRQMASYFDQGAGRRHGFAPMDGVHRTREREQAMKGILDQPLDPEFLKILMQPEMVDEIDNEGRRTTRVVSRPSPEQTLEYAEKLLIAEPYNPENWTSFVSAKFHANPSMSYFELEPYRLNAVVFSDHSVNHLGRFLMEKAAVFDALGQIERGEISPEHAKPFENANSETDVVCPFVRALRLHDHKCRGRANLECRIVPQVEAMFAIVEEDAKQRGICLKERRLPASLLFFKPQDILQGG